MKEQVIKCSLKKRLKWGVLEPEIQRLVINVSKATNRGSLIFNRLLLHCLEHNIELPNLNNSNLYLQCFQIGIGSRGKKIESLQTVYDMYFKDFPEIENIAGHSQCFTYASNKYFTNFKNYLKGTLWKRTYEFVLDWVKVNTEDKKKFKNIAYVITSRIFNYEVRSAVPKNAEPLIEEQKKILGNCSNKVSEFWIGRHMSNAVTYLYHILKTNEKNEESKRFSLAPISRLKRHFITIDCRSLYHILKTSKTRILDSSTFEPLKEQEIRANAFECFRTIFKLECPRSKTFGNMLETDGVSLCIHLRCKKKEQKNNNKGKTQATERVIAIDPGRVNLVYAIEDDGETIHKLTKKTYYAKSGINTLKRKTSVWEKRIRHEEKIFSEFSPRTSSSVQFDSFLKNYISVYEKLWNSKTEKKWSRERFRVHGLKRRTLDRFFFSMNPNDSTVIVYGNAKFPSNKKNEISAPTTSVAKACMRFFHTEFVDEFNTTKMCHECHEELLSVKSIKNKRLVDVRGLHWCCSTTCNRHLYNRDKNSALNILECIGERPEYLSRKKDFDSEPKTKRFLYLKNLYLNQGETTMKMDGNFGNHLVIRDPHHE